MSARGMSARTGVALFGLGRIGMIHFQNAIRNHRLTLLYVVEPDGERASKILADFNQENVKVVSLADEDTVYNDDRVEFIVVGTPTAYHEKIVKKGLKHGKGVFCEKPVGLNLTGTTSCYEEADRVGKPLFCSFNRRFDPGVRKLYESIHKDGAVGQIHIVKICSRDNPPASMEYLRPSGKYLLPSPLAKRGIFHDSVIHTIDMICWLLQEFPTSVFTHAHAHCPDIREINDVDTVVIVMKFPSGVIGNIDCSRHSPYGYDQRIEVFGTKGMIESGNQRPDNVASHTSNGSDHGCYYYSFPQRYADSYRLAMEHFIDVVKGITAIDITGADTIKTTHVVNACEESWKQGVAVQLNLGGS